MDLLERSRVLAVVRYRVPGDVASVLRTLASAGALAEVTADTPGAVDAVRELASQGLAAGAGTILDPATATAFVDAGAAFLVSPSVVAPVADVARERGIPVLLGALTPTEVAAAIRAGADAVKLFPASLGGVAYLRALRGPFPDVAFVPTGGIEVGDIPTWLEAGAAGIALGTSLVGDDPPADAGALEALRARAERAVANAT